MNVPVHNDILVDCLSEAIAEGGAALRQVPGLLKRIIREEAWQSRLVKQTGEPATFKHFEEFVSTGPPEGLGANIPMIQRLCAEDVDALTLIDQEIKRKHGGDRKSAQIKVDNVNLDLSEKPEGNSRHYALRRLRQERPDLHAKVVAKELSPNAAMIAAGFRRRTLTVPLEPIAAARALRRHFTDSELQEFRRALSEQDP